MASTAGVYLRYFLPILIDNLCVPLVDSSVYISTFIVEGFLLTVCGTVSHEYISSRLLKVMVSIMGSFGIAPISGSNTPSPFSPTNISSPINCSPSLLVL